MTEHEETAKPARRKLAGIFGLAVLAGVLVGAVAVYVKERPSGNDAGQTAADAACAKRTDVAKALDKAATGQVAAMQASHPPSSVASLSFTGPDGKPMTVADFKGKTLLVNLWASWCAPCREEMPALDRLQAEMAGDDFQVVAINVDTGDASKPERFLKEVGVKALPRYRDSSMTAFNELKRKGLAYGLPVTMIVDKDGCELTSMNGPADWTSADAKRLLDKAIGADG
jgi:thiol-disulfide isomerase/thioredoxin